MSTTATRPAPIDTLFNRVAEINPNASFVIDQDTYQQETFGIDEWIVMGVSSREIKLNDLFGAEALGVKITSLQVKRSGPNAIVKFSCTLRS